MSSRRRGRRKRRHPNDPPYPPEHQPPIEEAETWAERRARVLGSDEGAPLRYGYGVGYGGYAAWWEDQLDWYGKVESRQVDTVAIEVFGGFYYCVGDVKRGKQQEATAPR